MTGPTFAFKLTPNYAKGAFGILKKNRQISDTLASSSESFGPRLWGCEQAMQHKTLYPTQRAAAEGGDAGAWE